MTPRLPITDAPGHHGRTASNAASPRIIGWRSPQSSRLSPSGSPAISGASALGTRVESLTNLRKVPLGPLRDAISEQARHREGGAGAIYTPRQRSSSSPMWLTCS
jgi:hypothetical protein